jgi:hypothetical protein
VVAVKQAGPMELSVSKYPIIEAKGIVQAGGWDFPVCHLLSQSVATALMDAGATGCEILECKLVGNESEIERCGKVFQFRITDSSLAPCGLGTVTMGLVCPGCGCVKSFMTDTERAFTEAALRSVDFQICSSYRAKNMGPFQILNGFPIASERIFKVLQESAAGGLTRYSTDPPVKYAAVDVRA